MLIHRKICNYIIIFVYRKLHVNIAYKNLTEKVKEMVNILYIIRLQMMRDTIHKIQSPLLLLKVIVFRFWRVGKI